MDNSLISNFDSRISLILKSQREDRSRLLFDEYRTSNYESRDTFLLTLIARLLLEHDRRVLGPTQHPGGQQ